MGLVAKVFKWIFEKLHKKKQLSIKAVKSIVIIIHKD